MTAMALGQASGTATALAFDRGLSPRELNGRDVREKLLQQHAGPVLPNERGPESTYDRCEICDRHGLPDRFLMLAERKH